MNRSFRILLVVAMLACAGALNAQDANPIGTNLKESWANIRDLLMKMADKMPEENYRFKPTPEMQDFGQRMAHIAGANMHVCAMLRNEKKDLAFSAAPSKPEVLAAMKQANEECDAAFNAFTDADYHKMINSQGMTGRPGPAQRLELAALEGNVIEHSQEVYGYACVYLRLKGIVPPSSDRSER